MEQGDLILPVTCRACKGTGVGRRMSREDGTYTISPCVCVRCKGAGAYCLLEDKDWELTSFDVDKPNQCWSIKLYEPEDMPKIETASWKDNYWFF